MDTILNIMSASLAIATPLIITSMAGLFCERSGVVDIGLEGKLTMTAFAAAFVSYWVTYKWGWSYGAYAGLFAGIFAGVLLSLAHAYACVSKGGDQIVSGVAINFFSAGFTIVVTRAVFGSGDTPPIKLEGGTFHDFAGQNTLTWLALVMIPTIWLIMYKTKFGLRLRAVGENPHAVDVAGISVKKVRYIAVLIGGGICGIAGTFLSLGASQLFTKDMSSGRGYIALVVLILGRWKPVQTLLGCLLFGFLQASSDYLPTTPTIFGVSLGNISPLISILPYVLVLIIMVFIGKSVAPAAVGVPYKKER